jgi:multimeric flavodoxin WrbA
MKVIALNGSPRKSWNTAKLLDNALEGAKDKGADTELINLYDLEYKGCRSCFACKRQNLKSYGACCINDDLKPLFNKISQSDVLLLGSPIYFCNVTAAMRAFLERFLFQYLIYSNPPSNAYYGSLKVAFIYTMNVKETTFFQSSLKQGVDVINSIIERTFGNIKTLYSFFTYQTDNYKGMEYSRFDIEEKKEYHESVFPLDCKKAYDLGSSLV